MERECFKCHRLFNPSSRHKLCPSCRGFIYKTPCPKCGKLIQPKSKLCGRCDSESRRKFDTAVQHRGYILSRDRNHPNAQKGTGYIFKHILIMEKHLGRYLLPGENVHHKNGIRNDNRVENLELWIKPQPSGVRAKDAIKWAKRILEIYGNDERRY